MIFDLLKEGTLTVEGTVDGETYTVDTLETNGLAQVVITFNYNGNPGLAPVSGGPT